MAIMSTCALPDFTPPPPIVGTEARHRHDGVGRVGIYLATGGEFLVAAVRPRFLYSKLTARSHEVQDRRSPPGVIFSIFSRTLHAEPPGLGMS